MLGTLLLLAPAPGAVPTAATPPEPAPEVAREDHGHADAPSVQAVESEGAMPSKATERDEERILALEKRIVEQDARIAALEAERASSSMPVDPATDARASSHAGRPTPPAADQAERGDPLGTLASKDFPRSIPMFGSDFRFALGGYVKLDVIYDLSGHGDRHRFTLAGIPKEGEPTAGAYLSMHARETRLKLDVRYTGQGAPPNQALVEFDFFSPTDFAAPRLRHAYLRWGAFLAGQTWALLTDMRPLPFIIDFAFADSINATRVPQLRYQSFVTDFLLVRAGVEMPETSGVDNPEAAPGAVSPRLPRAALAASLEAKRGFVSAGFSLGEIRWDVDDTSSDPTALAWMAVLNGRYLLDRRGRAFIGAHASIGEGTGELVGALAGQNSNATLRAGALAPLLSGHGMLGSGIRWIEAISTNAAVAWDVLVPSPDRSADALEWAWSVHANVVGHISEPLQVGLEGMLGESANVDGRAGRGARIQGMVMYSF